RSDATLSEPEVDPAVYEPLEMFRIGLENDEPEALIDLRIAVTRQVRLWVLEQSCDKGQRRNRRAVQPSAAFVSVRFVPPPFPVLVVGNRMIEGPFQPFFE